MQKHEAIARLGGTVTAAAQAIGVTPSAIVQWPDDLPPRLRDRVQAAIWRMVNSSDGQTVQPGVDAQQAPIGGQPLDELGAPT